MKKGLILIVIFFLISRGVVFGDTIILKSGKTVDGKILEETDKYTKIDFQGTTVTYFSDEIDKIIKQSIKDDSSPKQEATAVSENEGKWKKGMGQQEAVEKGLLKLVDDPPTAEAINNFQKKSAEIGHNCPKPEGSDMNTIMAKISECVCANLPALVEANQTKVNAFADLLKRKPELANQMVKIEGAFGNFMLNPEDLNKNTLEEMKREYHCQ